MLDKYRHNGHMPCPIIALAQRRPASRNADSMTWECPSLPTQASVVASFGVALMPSSADVCKRWSGS
jgi:hypothetical protein